MKMRLAGSMLGVAALLLTSGPASAQGVVLPEAPEEPEPQSAPAPSCKLTLQGANVWTGTGFERRDLHIDGPTFAASAPQGAIPFPAQWMWVIPPIVDTHNHGPDQPLAANDPSHRQLLDQGIFYALNPNNIRRSAGLAPFGPDQVEALYSGGGITGPGGHPRQLYEMLVANGILRGVTRESLPGSAFHEVSTEAEVRAAVERVQAQGSNVVKLYLLDHETPSNPTSKGLTPALFRVAVAHAVRRNIRPIVHIETAGDFRLAAGTRGVALIVHIPGVFPRGTDDAPYLITAEDAALAARNNVALSTTISVAFNSLAGEQLVRVQRIQAHNLRMLRDANVLITAGADRPSASAIEELELLRATGLFDGTQLLNIATLNGARLLFPGRKIGAFEPGGEASFLIHYADPRSNWLTMDEPMAGLRGGQVLLDRFQIMRSICGGAGATGAPAQ